MKLGKIVFENLKGTWNFERKISHEDFVKGAVVFKEIKPDILSYCETGTWQKRNKIISVFRDYLYCYNSKTNKIAIFFAEEPPRLFYELNLVPLEEKHSGYATATGEHLCGNDVYLAHYEFISKDQFSLFYQVTGPKKKYHLQTDFKKIAA